VVGTPIGNLGDLSPRAVRALGEANVIYCEDTRRTRKLLSALGLRTPRLERLDSHAEEATASRVVAEVSRGSRAVIVSDAGMPSVSDPGSRAVAAVARAGLAVEVVPGPTAVSAALAVSGLPASQYRFVGFLPRKGGDRRRLLDSIARDAFTTVIFEAPTRVKATVDDLAAACGRGREFVAARELTKVHEEVWRGTLGEAVDWLEAVGEPRGEWVLMVAGAPSGKVADATPAEVEDALRARLASGLDRRAAVAAVAADLALPKRQVYDVNVSLKAKR
jgi:16S rRNA (cytidine1402-2'-O)-methyltransferase